jgi:hypothetical protein
MSFTDEEIAYLRSQPLVRLATVGPDGQPDATWYQLRRTTHEPPDAG